MGREQSGDIVSGELKSEQTPNGKTRQNLDWPTVILILFSGGTNFLATQKNSSDREYQVDQAVKQIRELHASLDEFEARQKTSLDNQRQLLEHDSVLLKEVHEIALKLQNWKVNEQMRGAPDY